MLYDFTTILVTVIIWYKSTKAAPIKQLDPLRPLLIIVFPWKEAQELTPALQDGCFVSFSYIKEAMAGLQDILD